MNKIRLLSLNLCYIAVLSGASVWAQSTVEEPASPGAGWTFYTSSLSETDTITWAARYKNNDEFEMYEAYSPRLKNLSNCGDMFILQKNEAEKEELYLKCKDINQNDYIVSLRNQHYEQKINRPDIVEMFQESETQGMSWQQKLSHYEFEHIVEQNIAQGKRKIFKRSFVSPYFQDKFLDLYFVVDINDDQSTERLQTILVSFIQCTRNTAGKLIKLPLSFQFIQAIPGNMMRSPSLLFSAGDYKFQFSTDNTFVKPAGFTERGFQNNSTLLKSFINEKLGKEQLDLSFIEDEEKNKVGSAYMTGLSQLYFDIQYSFFWQHWSEYRRKTLFSSVLGDVDAVWIMFKENSFLVSRSTLRHIETMHRNNDRLRHSAMSYGIIPMTDLKELTGFSTIEMYAGISWGNNYDETQREPEEYNFLSGGGGSDFYWRETYFDNTEYVKIVGLTDKPSIEQLITFFE